MSQKYVIVHFLDVTSVPAEFPFTEWPLHVTLLANFALSQPVSELELKLREYAAQQQPFEITADGEALFGPKQNVSVSLIRPIPQLRQLHDSLAAMASQLGAIYDEPKYMGDGFRPHATIKPYGRLEDRQTMTLNSFSLVDMYPDGNIERRRLIKTYTLAG